jgi:hypothetical protein
MNSYAQIIDGVVTQQTVAAQMPVDGTTWIDVTTLSPQPTLGWTYNGISFATPPVYLYAQVIDGIVTQVMSAFAIPVDGTKWLDITTLSPSPAVDWSYDGTSFSPPPIYLYARVIGGIVTRIMTAFTMPADGTLWVDITNVTPAPAIDWRYDGASFTLPPVNVYA